MGDKIFFVSFALRVSRYTFPSPLAIHTDNRHVNYTLHCKDNALDLRRIDIQASGNYQVSPAIIDIQGNSLGLENHVAGTKRSF